MHYLQAEDKKAAIFVYGHRVVLVARNTLLGDRFQVNR